MQTMSPCFPRSINFFRSTTLATLAIFIGLVASWLMPPDCAAVSKRTIVVSVSPQDELSEEEAKSIKIAERFFSILEKSPRRGTALERVYGHHVEFGTLDEFLKGLRDRTEKDPEDGTAWMLLGMFESHRGEDADAVDALAKAEQFLTEDAMPSYYMGQSLLLIGQPEKAVAAFERAIERKPRRPDMLEIFRQLGRVHQRAQRTEEALQVWDRLEKLFPDDARVQEQIAVTMVEEGEYKLALPRYEKLVTLVKDDYRKVTFNIEAAELKIRLNQRKEGIADLEKLLADLNPTGWLFRDVRRRIEDIFLRSGDQDGLVTYYQDWIKANPEDIGAIARLARFLASSARVAEASEWMEKALTLAPKRTDLRKSFINQLVNDQRYTEASKQYALLVESAPGNPDFLRDWGKLVMKDRNVEKSKRREQAVKIWSRIIEARPNDAITHSQVADLYRQSGLEAEAIERYEKSIELAPGEAQYREYLGEYFHILKRSDEALKIWEAIAEGKRETPENVARLAEVYNSFGYLPQAVEKIALACKLDPKEFALQLRAAEYHMRHGKYDESLAFNAAAGDLAASEEESDLTLKNRIEIFQSNRKLGEEIERLREAAQSNEKQTVEDWHVLARYLEADRDWDGASEAIEKALAINEKSIPVLTTSARVAETSGDYGAAAAVNRKLAEVDRRLRSEHLMNVARLEAQLGNRDEAIAAGKELIVSAPGNTDNYEFYAQLCYRLGETDMALDTLRKAVRINPTEPALTMSLGRALAEEFRTDEAIEVYWRAFEKSEEIDDKTSLVQKLTDLYGQQNQFDKLIERLERDRREESKRREMTICIAQAHNSSGDYGTARRELESLLTDNTKDTNLLQQLSKLCESGSDLAAAVEYQTQLAKIAPGHESEFRLAKLLFSNGQREAASDIFMKLTAREENPVRLLKSIDGLLQRMNYESVVKITEPLVSESRDDWELLYREGVAFGKQDKFEEAKIRFERILSLSVPHDKMGVVAAQQFKRANQKAKSNNNRGIRSQIPERQSAFQLARSQSDAAKRAVGLAEQQYYGNNQLPPLWTPSHYGVARMAAYAWLMRLESDAELKDDLAETDVAADGNEDADIVEEEEKERVSFTDAIVEKGSRDDSSQDEVYDWLYVEFLKDNYSETFQIAKRLAIDGGKPEQKFFLTSLPMRHIDVKSMAGQEQTLADPDPLSEDEIELMLKCFKATSKEDDGFGSAVGHGKVLFSGGRMYVRVGNSYQSINQGNASMAQVVKELKLAGKEELAEEMVSEKVAAAKSSSQLTQVMQMLVSEKKLEQLDDYFQKWKSAALESIELAPIKVSRRGNSANKHHSNQTAAIHGMFLKWTGPLAKEEENAKVLSAFNDIVDVEMKELAKKRKQAKASRKKSRPRSANQYYDKNYTSQYGDETSNASVDYPRPSAYLSTTGLRLLHQVSQVLKKNEVEDDLMALLRERIKKAQADSPETLNYERMLLATLLFWQDEKDESVEMFRAVASSLQDDPSFQFEIASLYEKLGDFDESLSIVEAIEPRGQQLVEQKETTVLRLAERLGDLERARIAAERLFGLRLKAQTQLSLVANMKRLGLSEMADAVISRAQRRSGQKLPAMVSLMGLYQGQGKTDLATQVAHRILQRTRSTVSQAAMINRNRRYSSRNSDEAYRRAAISLLQQTGELTALTERLEEQQKRSPDSPAIYEKLIEFYMQTNNAEKLIPLLETAVKSRPKSGYFREQLAKQYSSKGMNDEACEQYAVAIRENPSMLSNDYHMIKQFFQAAGKLNKLLEIFQEINIREIGQPYYVAEFASTLLQQSQTADSDTMSDEEKKTHEATETAAIRLAEKIFDEYPSYRRYVLQNFRNTEVWKNKRLFSLARRSLIPARSQVKANPWYGLSDISSYGGNGEVNSMFHDIFKSIEGADEEKVLRDSISKHIELKPDWLAGRIMLAMFDVRDDKEDEAKKALTELFADEKVMDSVRGQAASLVAQELEKFSETRDIALKLLEKAVKNEDHNNNSIQYSAAAKLVTLYANADQKEKARELLVKALNKDSHQNYDQQYQMYQKGEAIFWGAGKLLEIGCPADAVSVMQSMVNNDEILNNWRSYGGRNREDVNRLYTKALGAALADGDSADLAKKIIAVREKPRTGEGAFDLQVGIKAQVTNRQPLYYTINANGQQVPFYGEEPEDKGAIQCKFFDLIDSLSKKEIGKELLSKRLKELREEKPEDKSIAIASAWFELKHNPDGSEVAAKSLLDLIDKYPLDEIREGRRPNSRQRRAAMEHVALWPITVKCLRSKDESLRDFGQTFGELAIEGAKRQTNKSFQQKMLFDWGQVAIKKKDAKQAEAKWSELLDEVTKRPTRKKKKATPGAVPGRPGTVSPPAMPGTSWNLTVPPGSRVIGQLAALFTAAPATCAILQDPVAAAPPIEEKKKTETTLIPPLTNSQFETAHKIALAAAKHDMVTLSKRAMHELLKGGLPVADPNFEVQNNRGGIVRYSSPGNQPSGNATSATGFGEQIISVLNVWKSKKDAYDAAEVYDMVVSEIFPANRPEEILLYEDSGNIDNAVVSSLAQAVVQWAAKADRIDDLNQRIEQRKTKPRSEVQAMVLSGMVALEQKNIEAAKASLENLLEHVTSKPVERDIQLACHVAVPAYDADKSLRDLCIGVFRKNIESRKETSLGKIASRVNRHLAASGGEAEVRKFFEDYLVAQQAQYANYGGDYGVYQMQRALYRAAADVANSNLTDLALEYIGRGQDVKLTTNYGTNEITGWDGIAQRVRSKPAKKRYESLKEWTLPEENRQTVRFVSSWSAPQGKELNDFYDPEIRDLPDSSLPGLNSNFLDLVDAAAAAGKMDDLKASVDAVDVKKHPEIEAIKVFIAIQTDDASALDKVKAYLDRTVESPKGNQNKSQRLNNKYQWCDHITYRLFTQKYPDQTSIFEDHRERIFNFDRKFAPKAAYRDYENAQAKVLGARLQPGTTEPLPHWTSRKPPSVGGMPWTIADNNRLTQLGSSSRRSETFWLNYPLKGDFKFSCEALGLGGAGVSFGGVKVDALSRQASHAVSVSGPNGRDVITRRTSTRVDQNRFSKLTIEVMDKTVAYSLDGKLLYEEELAGTFPWLFLHSKSNDIVSWRNPEFQGQPEIAKEVPLIVDDRMEGWSSGKEFRVAAEPKPNKTNNDEEEGEEPEELDWHAKDGVLLGKASEVAHEGSDSLISYFRPLSDGDQFAYEFLYEPGQKMANPMIGTVAVGLVDGEKVHELYAGDSELDEDSMIANIPDSPHAIAPVKLVAGEWNQVLLGVEDGHAEVDLNGTLVWRRPLSKLKSLIPGIQKYATQAAEVRGLTLKGDWPTEFPAALVNNAFASERQFEDADHNLITTAIGDRLKRVELAAFYDKDAADNKDGAEDSDEARYEKLRDWVLPGNGHGIRLDSIPVAKNIRTAEELAADEHSLLNCPAWDMISLAKESGKLDELTESVNKLDVPEKKTASKYRSVGALKTLLAIANEDDEAALSHMKEIYASVEELEAEAKKNKSQASYDRSLFFAPAWFAAARPALSGAADSLGKKCERGAQQKITARLERFASSSVGKELTQWNAIQFGAMTHDPQGKYFDQWRMVADGLLERGPAQTNSPLYFQSPLKGKFEITADVSLRGGNQVWLDYGGYAVIPAKKEHRERIAAGGTSTQKSRKKVPRLHSVVRYRIAVDGDVVETYVNDVRVSRHEFKESPRPWFALLANSSTSRPILQNVRITGQPEIPTEIDLLAADKPMWNINRGKKEQPDQHQYNQRYFSRGISHRQGNTVPIDSWTLKDGEVTAGSLTEDYQQTPIFEESWVPYSRPMLEDGEFEFEMFADAKKKNLCHVSIGRVALLLKEDGVWRHEIVAGRDENGVADKKIDGSEAMELKDGDWNQILLRLAGDKATLLVNDAEVATIDVVDAKELRFPGLFRYVDQSNAQIRNVKLRGSWPTSLPSVDQQELALTSNDPFDGVVTGEAKTYDLTQSIDELKSAGFEIEEQSQLEATGQGLKFTVRKNGDSEKWPTVKLPMQSESDFDVSIDFAELKIAKAKDWGCNFDLQVNFEDAEKSAITVGIRRDKAKDLFVLAQREHDPLHGERSYDWSQLFEPFDKGSLRLVRRDGVVYCVAGGEGKTQQVIGSYAVGQRSVSGFSIVAKSATDSSELDGIVNKMSVKVAQ